MAFGVPSVCVAGSDVDRFAFGFAGDQGRQGVAISRLCQSLAMCCHRVIDAENPLRTGFIDKKKFGPVEVEAKKLMPHFKA